MVTTKQQDLEGKKLEEDELYALVGQKGVFLQDMIKAKVLVPPAFIISGIVDRFMQETRLYAKIEAVLEVIKPTLDDTDSVVRASNEIVSLIDSANFSKDLTTDIFKEFDKLKANFVSVRHSLVVKDSLPFYLKNEFHSTININKENLLKAIKQGWATNFSPSALMFRVEKDFSVDAMFSVLLVQKMVDAEVSGICYTNHPIIKVSDQLFIEAILGVANHEKKYHNDTYIVSKKNWKLIGKTLNAQEHMLAREGDKTVELVVGELDQKKPKLLDEQIVALSKLACHIEKYSSNKAQRMEWVFSGKKFYILDTTSS